MNDATTIPDTAETLAGLRDALAARFLEREAEIDLLLVALVARCNLTLVGEPGMAKSALVRALGRAAAGERYFEAQLAPDTPAQSVLGPYSLPDLDRGVFRVNPAGMLPEARFALLDEGYRANAVLLDNLLGIANPDERHFHNGPEVVPVPLWTLVITCNRLPDSGDERTEAFRDRMTLTRVVEPVRSEEGRAAILRGQLNGSGILPALRAEEIEAAQAAAGRVACPEDFLADTLHLWRGAEEAGLPVSARRAGEIVRACRARAFLSGRSECRREDLTVAEHALWSDPEDRPVAAEVALAFASPARRRAAEIALALDDLQAEADAALPAWEAVPAEQDLPREAIEAASSLVRRANALGARAAAAAERAGDDTADLDALRARATDLAARVQRAAFASVA